MLYNRIIISYVTDYIPVILCTLYFIINRSNIIYKNNNKYVKIYYSIKIITNLYFI